MSGMLPWKRVLATHEEPQGLARDWPWPGDMFPGVALPCVDALDRWVIIRNGSRHTYAQVVDVGPFCEDDCVYVFGLERPRAERLKGLPCPRTLSSPESRATVPDGKGGWRKINKSNGAGIDLFPYTAKRLGIPIGENVEVEWKFAEP